MPFAYQPRNEIARIELAQEVIEVAGHQSRMSLSLVNKVDRAIRALVWDSWVVWSSLAMEENVLLLRQCGLIDGNNILTQRGKEIKKRIQALLV